MVAMAFGAIGTYSVLQPRARRFSKSLPKGDMKKIIVGVSIAAAGCAGPVPVPESLKPAANESLALIVPAKGAQIYECRDAKWAFVEPDAQLFDRAGRQICSHYAGPTWEAADGSKVIGAVKQRADAPAAGSIPWLLLGTKSVGNEGSFSKVTSIQRVATTGGVAPAGACAQNGERVRVPYTADYYLFTAK
jgi:hypothetical protein